MTASSGASTAADPTSLLALAVATAHEAAELVRRGRASAGDDVTVKSSSVDVVTAVDTASEQLIVGRLLAARPDDGVLGEEGAERTGTSGVRWVIDPIDGTVNFLYDLPAYAVSIAAEIDGVVGVGVVLNVATGELFTAVAGGGAFLSTPTVPEPLRLTGSRASSLEQSLVATGFGYRVEQRRAQGAVVAALLPLVRDIRRHGSAALELCAAAAGRVDAYYEADLKQWDHAAGALVAAEAGLVLAGLPGRPLGDRMVVAVAPAVADELLGLLAALHPVQADGAAG